MATCPEHPTVKLRCPACEGARGGAKNTPAQTTARSANVQRAIGKGGWPKGRPRGPRPPRAPKPVPENYGKPLARHEYGDGKRWPT